MAMFQNLTIRKKLLFTILLTTGSALVLAGAMLIVYDVISCRDGMTREYTTLARIISRDLAASLESNDQRDAQATLSHLRADTHLREVLVCDIDGNHFVSFALDQDGEAWPMETTLAPNHYFAKKQLHLSHPIQAGGRPLGSIYLRADMSDLLRRISQYIRIVASVLLISILLALSISTRLRGMIADPLKHLADTAQLISIHQDYSVRAEQNSRDEVGALTGAFNQMLHQIQQRDRELANQQSQLEAQVTTRTTELETINRDLIRAKENAVAAVKTKGEFLATMSHEIRTPMNGIIAVADLALSFETDSQNREYLKMILSSAETLLSIINDILDFSKIEAHKFSLYPEDFDLREAVYNTIQMLALRADQKGIESVCRIAPDVPNFLNGDVSRFRQLLINLIGNAIKFTDTGEILINIELAGADENDGSYNIVTTSDANNCQLQVSIRDSGIGIAPEKQRQIFEAFAQADSSTTRNFGGTGLGLAICTRLISMMGGRIWVESELGVGSTFHFTIPFAVQEAIPNTWNVSTPFAAIHEVLIIDGNASSRGMLEELLTSWNVVTHSLASGEAALMTAMSPSRAADSNIDLIIIDSRLPGVDGETVCRRYRSGGNLELPVIFLMPPTANSDVRDKALAAGATICMSKPVDDVVLYQNVSELLGYREGAHGLLEKQRRTS
jgi:signal transduction histidine kinase/FixJ family two-component response regulator